MPIAFCDAESNTYVNCNLAFYVRDPDGSGGSDEGVEYALGVSREVPIIVALELEGNNGRSPERHLSSRRQRRRQFGIGNQLVQGGVHQP